jgi:hypothetical protein
MSQPRSRNRTLSRRPLVGFLLAFLLSAGTVSAEVIWRGDFETGDTSQWKGSPKDGVSVVKDPVREGKYALRIDGMNAAKKGKLDRIEFQHQPKPPGTVEGTALLRLERLSTQETHRRQPLARLIRDPL